MFCKKYQDASLLLLYGYYISCISRATIQASKINVISLYLHCKTGEHSFYNNIQKPLYIEVPRAFSRKLCIYFPFTLLKKIEKKRKWKENPSRIAIGWNFKYKSGEWNSKKKDYVKICCFLWILKWKMCRKKGSAPI